MSEKEKLNIYICDDEDDDDDEEIESNSNPWYIKYFKVISFLVLGFFILFVLSGIVSLLHLFNLITIENNSIIYIICLMSLTFSIVSAVVRLIALNLNSDCLR